MMQDKAKHGGNVYEAVRTLGGSFADFLDYSANINPLGFPPLEKLLLESDSTIIFVEHDRAFCENIATKTIEL